MKLTQDLKIFKQIVQAHICGTTFPAWHLTHAKFTLADCCSTWYWRDAY